MVIRTTVLVVYDISDDKSRTKTSEACLDLGMDRIQNSTFWGHLTKTQIKELMAKIKSYLPPTTKARILLIDINQESWQRLVAYEQKCDFQSSIIYNQSGFIN